MKFIVIVAIVFICLMLGALLFMPTVGLRKKKKKMKKQQVSDSKEQTKDWAKIALSFERQVHSLRKDITALSKKEKLYEKQLIEEKEALKKVEEKLLQERGWQEREQKDIVKKGSELKQMKKDMQKIQDDFGKEHSENLRKQNEIKELRVENGSLSQEKKSVELESGQRQFKLDELRKEFAQLKKEHALLTKKVEDSEWVTKSEHIRLERLLKQKEEELNKIKGAP